MTPEDYVSFEIAKLLKEKGFDGQCKMKYNQEGTMLHHVPSPTDLMFTTDKKEIERHSIKNHIEYFLCPTLQMAMKWLREEHNILITIIPQEVNIGVDRMCYAIYKITENLYQRLYNGKTDSLVNSYEESCEAAIKYCLENLI